MILPLLFVFGALATAPPPSTPISCRNLDNHTSPVLRSSTGFHVRLALHTEDDHGRDTHLCQSDYTLHITHPDGRPTTADGFFGNLDAWDRPIAFHLAGFTHSGSGALILLREGGAYPIHEVILYDLDANTWEIADVAGALTRQLPATCLADLRIAGTTPAGDVVLTPPDLPACKPGSRWVVSLAGSDTGAPLAEPARILPASAAVLPLDTGSPSTP